MPLNPKGRAIMKNMEKEYGDKKGKSVFYASKNKGTIKGVEAKSEALKKKMKHPAERPEAYKSDVEKGWNRGRSMDISQVKSVLRHVDKEIRKK